MKLTYKRYLFSYIIYFCYCDCLTVTESEIRRGVLCEPFPEEHCFWISRNIPDLRDHLYDENAPGFIDINFNTREIDSDAQELLQVRKRTT